MTDPRAPTNPAAEGQDWLDGLAGRHGTGESHREGKLLREALAPTERADLPTWAEIELRAGVAPTSKAVDDMPAVGLTPAAAVSAANEPTWRAWYGVAATAVLGVALAISMWPPHADPGMRGLGPAGTGEAIWRVAQPQQAAAALAAELQALGAQVEVKVDGGAQRLVVTAPVPAVEAVNQRLAVLETALDAQGRLTLRVEAPR